jgi:hypothetical protein
VLVRKSLLWILRIWAISPLAFGLMLFGDMWTQFFHPLPQGSMQWYLVTEEAAGLMPTPDSIRNALRNDLPSGRILYQGLGHVQIREGTRDREVPALFVELVGPGSAPLFSAVRSPFFGPTDLDLDDMLGMTLKHADRPKPIIQAADQKDSVTLRFEGGQAYREASLVKAITVNW